MSTGNKLDQLVDEVENLLAALSHEYSPEIMALRAQVEVDLESAKRAIASEGKSTTARLIQYARSVDGFITEYPRLAFVTGALIGSFIGYVAGLARSSE